MDGCVPALRKSSGGALEGKHIALPPLRISGAFPVHCPNAEIRILCRSGMARKGLKPLYQAHPRREDYAN
jgi:hypothetical protein